MVLVDGDHVEAELLRVDQLVEVGLVLVRPFLRIVERVRQHHPAGAMLVTLGHVERAVRHQMEEGELHEAQLRPISRKTFCAATSGFSIAGTWPHCGNDLDGSVRDPFAPARGVVLGEELVVLAPHHQGRDADAVQPAFQRRIEPARVPAELGGGEAVGQRDVGLVVGHRHRQHPVGDRLVVIEVAHRLFGTPDEIVAGGDALDPDAGRRQQRETCEARTAAHRHLGRGPAAERLPDEMHLVDPKPVEEIEVVHGEVADVAHPGGIVRGAITGMLGDADIALFRQELEERQPLRQPVGAMQEYDRRTGAAAQHPDADVTDLMSRLRRRHDLAIPLLVRHRRNL